MAREEITLNGRYRLLERVGSGGMSVVYNAHDLSLGRIVAVKMLHENLTSDEGFLRRFQQEAHAAANLTHPNIVTVHDLGQDEYRHYIVMEYVEGKTLKEIIRDEYDNGRSIPINRALDLTIQICAGIGYAHRANLVHCDVKPQNVLVTSDERVKVADFGIARAVSSATQQNIISQIWGTPQYFSPEQAAGEAATPASDVYAIGIVMFEMLTGRLPFEAESHTAMALKHLQAPPPPVSQFNPGVPPELEQIILKILAKEPSGRYRTAGQLGRILSTYRQSTQAVGPFAPATSESSASHTPISEQKTQIYERHIQTPASALDEDTPVRLSPVHVPPQAANAQTTAAVRQQAPIQADGEKPITDWTAVTLGIAAMIALLGLIPLWWMVYLAWAG